MCAFVVIDMMNIVSFERVGYDPEYVCLSHTEVIHLD